MCRSCGCRVYDDDMGEPDTIVTKTLVDAGTASGKSIVQVETELHEALHQDKGSSEIPMDRIERAAKAMGQKTADAVFEVHDSLHHDGHKHPGE